MSELVQEQNHRPVFAPESWPDERVEQAAYSARGKRNPQFPFSKTPFVLQVYTDHSANVRVTT